MESHCSTSVAASCYHVIGSDPRPAGGVGARSSALNDLKTELFQAVEARKVAEEQVRVAEATSPM